MLCNHVIIRHKVEQPLLNKLIIRIKNKCETVENSNLCDTKNAKIVPFNIFVQYFSGVQRPGFNLKSKVIGTNYIVEILLWRLKPQQKKNLRFCSCTYVLQFQVAKKSDEKYNFCVSWFDVYKTRNNMTPIRRSGHLVHD